MTEPRTWEEARNLVIDMMDAQGPAIAKMREVLHHYNGEWAIPLPELDNEPNMPNLTPALVADAVDFLATRAASTSPRTSFVALDPNKDTGIRSRQYAAIRGKATSATLEQSKWKLGRRKFYRHLTAYGTGAIMVEPDWDDKIPRIQVRDPLCTFAEPRAAVDLRRPNYVAFTVEKSGGYLREKFPMLRDDEDGPISDKETTQMWTLCEFVDCDQRMYGLLGPVQKWGWHIAAGYSQDGNKGFPLDMQIGQAYPNPLGRVTGVVPENVSLDKIASRIGALLGNVELQAKMMALNITAIERSIFPDLYAIGAPNGQPAIVGGVWQDGRTMKVNLLRDVASLGQVRAQPDPAVQNSISQLERNFSKSTGLVPQAGGETYGALRTGRGIDALASIALDPTIQEMHEISEVWMAEINADIIDTYKVCWPNKSYSMYSTWPGDRGQVEFTPSIHFESTMNVVSYVVAGADTTQTTQIAGSLLGTGAISRRTFRAMHPWIGDPEGEGRLADEEAFEDALKQTIVQQMVAGTMDPMVVVMIRDFMMEDEMDIFAAARKANEEMQKLQATPAPPAPEGMVAPPEAMPGLTAGPTASQQPMPEAPPQVQTFGDVSRMRELMTSMGAQG